MFEKQDVFAFELNFTIEENLQEFTSKGVKKILNKIQEIDLQSVKAIKPTLVIKKESKLLSFKENHDIFYKIIIHIPIVDLIFYKGDREFGKFRTRTDVSAADIFRLIMKKTLLPTIIPEDDLMFAVLRLYGTLEEITSS